MLYPRQWHNTYDLGASPTRDEDRLPHLRPQRPTTPARCSHPGERKALSLGEEGVFREALSAVGDEKLRREVDAALEAHAADLARSRTSSLRVARSRRAPSPSAPSYLPCARSTTW